MNPTSATWLRRATLLGLTALLPLAGACHLDWNADAPPTLPVAVELPVARPRAPRPAPIDVEHYAIRLALHPDDRSVEGSCDVRFKARERDLLRVELDFAGLEVKDVRDDEQRELAWKHTGDQLVIDLAEVLRAGDSTQLTVDYSGRPKKGLWFVGDRDGRPTQVFTQGECEDSRWWFPCQDIPSDFATSEVTVTMPASWTAMAAGDRVERVENGRTATEHWRMTEPHAPYLTTLVAGDFVVRKEQWKDVPLYYLAEPRYAKWMEASFRKTGETLAFLEDLTGVAYPWSKYSQACVANFPFGGMENVSATTLTAMALEDELGRRDSDTTGLVAHEAAHQWFGDLVTCQDWSHVWLNESFATYAGLLFVERTEGEDAFRIAMRDAQESYIAEDSRNRRPIVYSVYTDPMDLFGAHVYPGGASRLHLLRSILGDDRFVAGIRGYVKANAGGPVTTSALQYAFEQASGERLDWFFDQWLESPGFPEFEVDWSWDRERQKLRVNVAQTQTGADGVPRAFRTPVDIEIRDRGGRTTDRVWITDRRHSFEFDVSHEPIWVRFDKYGWIPKKLNSIKEPAEWLAIAEEDDDVNGRRDAVRKLAQLAHESLDVEMREVLRGEVAARLKSETNPDVRAAAARAASVAGGLEARTELEDVAVSDPEAKVRVAALEALIAYCPAPDLAQLALEEYDARFSWNTMGAAAGLYAAADPAEAYKWLTVQLLEDSPHDQLRSNLLRRLGALENQAVTDQLKNWAADESTHPAARAVAVEELAKRARGRAPIAKFLIGMLDEENFRLRGAVVKALGEFHDPRTRAALYDYYQRTVFPREKRTIEAALGTGL